MVDQYGNTINDEYADLFAPRKFKKWELHFNKIETFDFYKIYQITPSLMFIIDKQSIEYYNQVNEEPIIEYSLLLEWLGFSIGIYYNKKIKV